MRNILATCFPFGSRPFSILARRLFCMCLVPVGILVLAGCVCFVFHPKVDEFPQRDLADVFAAVFVGVKRNDFTHAAFARVDKGDFVQEA